MTNQKQTVLSDFNTYNVDDVIFDSVKENQIEEKGINGEKGQTIRFHKVYMQTKNPDGTVGDLIISTPKCFSFGVSKNMLSGSVKGYTLPLCLYSRDGATDEEKHFVQVFESIVDKCIDHVLDIKDEVDKFDLERRDLVKTKGGLNPLYYKRERYTDENGRTKLRVVPGTGPTLYAKLMYSAKTESIATKFYHAYETDEHGEEKELDPMNLISSETEKKYCYAQAALKFESIFIGSNDTICLQVKVQEAVIEPSSLGPKRLLKSSFTRPPVEKRVQMDNSMSSDSDQILVAPTTTKQASPDDDDKNSLVDEPVVTPRPVLRKKRIVKKANE